MQTTTPQGVVVACSGGADSLGLAWLAQQELGGAGVPLHVVVIDHGLQPDSALVADRVRHVCRWFGFSDVAVIPVTVEDTGRGLEADARDARRAALSKYAHACGADQVWLGHTLDDQAETLLIGLTHGSGARSLAGMADRDGIWCRPLLHCRRQDVRAVIPAAVEPWQDPHNEDQRFTRARVRHLLMPVLVDVLGERAVVNLARSAHLLAGDNDALDDITQDVCERATHGHGEVVIAVADLAAVAPAVRTRAIRHLSLIAGATARDLTSEHIGTVARMVQEPHLTGPILLPGPVSVRKASGQLVWSAGTTISH